MKPWERYSSGPWTRFKGVSLSDDGVAPFALPEEEPAPRFQTRGLGVPEPVEAPLVQPSTGSVARRDSRLSGNRDITPEEDPFAGEGFGDLAARRGQQFAKGATEVVASIPEASAISSAGVEQTQVEEAQKLLERRAQQITDLQSRLVDGMPERERAFIEQQISDLQIGQDELRKRASVEVVPASERDRFKIGDQIRQKSEDIFGAPDPRDTSFWASVAEAGGNAAGFGVASLVPGGVAVGAGIGASLNKAQVYKEAIEAGADEETAQKASDFAMVFGASEIVPISRALKALPPRLRPKVGGVVMRKFADIAQAAGEEAAQEYLQTVANNVVAQKLYDPERGWTDGATEGALVGAVVGGILGGGVALATPSRPDTNDRERINSPRLTDNDRASPLPNDVIDDGKKAIEDILAGRVPQGAVPMDTLYGKPIAPLDEAAPNVRTPTPEAVQRPLPTDRLSPTLGAAPSAGALPKLTLRPSIGETPSLLTGGNLNAEPVFIDSVDAQTIRGRVEATGEPFEIPAQAVRDGLYSFQTNQSDPSRRRSIGVPEIDAPIAKSVDYAKVPQRVLMLAREGSARLNELTPAEQTEMRNAGLVPDELGSFNIHALEQEAQDRMARGDWDASQSIFAKDSNTPAAQDAPQRPFEDVPEMDGDVDTGRTVRVYEDGQVEFVDPQANPATPQANQEQNAQAQEPVPQTQEPLAVSDVPTEDDFRANRYLENEDLTRIEADPETFQYKSGGDAEGVTDRLLGVKKWETPRAGQAIVYEYADGRQVIADGHQRLGLAKRLRAEGQDVAMPVTIRREVDGYTPEQVMVEAALKNVAESDAKDPNPEAIIDAAKVLRARPNITPADMNLPNGERSALGRNALSLRSLSDEAFGMLVNERASMRSALAVANAVSDKAAQANILAVVEKSGARNRFEAEMVAKQAAADTVTQTQDSLFGSEDVTETLYLERARVMDQAIKRLRNEASAFKTILRNAGNIENVGENRVDRDASAQKAAEDAAAQEYITRLANSKGPISDALTEAARSIKAGGNTGQAVTGFVQAVRSGLQESGGGRQAGTDIGRNAQQVRGTEAGQVAPNAERVTDGDLFASDANTQRSADADLPALDVDAASKALADARASFNVLDQNKKIEDAQAYFAASSALSKARDGMADALAERGGRIELKTDNGLGAVITPRPDGKPGARITYFDGKGFSGDTSHDTLKAAVRDAIGQGYEIEAKGYLKNRQALWPKSKRTDVAETPPKQSAKTLPKLNEGFVIRNKDTGEAVMETRDQAKIDALNTDKYDAVPVRQHLAELNDLNSKARKAAEQAPAAKKASPAVTKVNDIVAPDNAEGTGFYTNSDGDVQIDDLGNGDAEITITTSKTRYRGRAKETKENSQRLKYSEVKESLSPAAREAVEKIIGEQAPQKAAEGGGTSNAPIDNEGNTSGSSALDDADWWANASRNNDGKEARDVLEKAGLGFDRVGRPWKDIREADRAKIQAARNDLPTTERTEAGTQTVVPGAEQSTERSEKARDADRKREVEVRARQSKMRTGVPQDGPGGLFDTQGDMFDAPRQDAVPQQSAPTAKIEDFGEKLEGAQKDKVKGWLDRANQVADNEIVNVPLSKAWPEPDYQAMIDEGIDPEAVAFMHAARDEIPNKPRQKWKVERWAQQVKVLRTFTSQIASGDIDIADVKARMTASMSGLRGRMALYEEYGHEKSLKDITLKEGAYSAFKGERFDKPRNIWTVRDKGNIVSHGATEAEAIAGFSEAYGDLGNLNERTKGTKFEIRKWRGGSVFIGKKVGKDWIEVETNPEWDWKEARAYLAENQEALEAKFKRMKELPPERGEDNSPRVGVDHRNGQDVTPEMFSETFGFRGVQFGNYVEGPRRQADLNEAYDGLMDLAGIINVPPKAMSLNGTLGLAFGARGSGRKAKAHYEPDTVVINLTKGSGAGSLAHEWWHGLDHYFAKQGGKEALLLTETGGRGLGDGIRPEVVAAFQNLMTAVRQAELNVRSQQADKRKSKPYFSKMEEMTARSFESYVIGKLQDQSASNDYLANILSEDAWNALEAMAGQDKPSWPYVTVSEMPAFREAFDKLFDTIQTEETAGGTVRLFQRQPDNFAAEFMKELAAVDELFAYPKSTSTTVEGVFADIDPMVEFVGETQTLEETAEKGADERYLLRSANGKDFYVYQNEDEVWIDVSQVGEGGGGNSIYAAIGDYAFNTDRKFIGDPDGLSQIALRRRTEAMLSSALKHGTTDHLAPHQYQLDGDESIGVPPLSWTRGDTVGNIQSLIEVSNASLTAIVPEIKNARYDFQTRTFRNSKGERLSDATLDDFRDRFGRIGEAGAGRRTLKRGILYATLLRQESGKRPGLLERALRQSDKYVNDGDLKGTFYQRSDTQDAATVEAALPDLQKRLKQLMLGRVKLEAVEGATFQGAFEARGDDLRILVGATQDSMKTVNHEAVHALRNLNLFTDAEWDALSDQAVAEWLDKYDIANRYDDLNAEAQIEEAIAEAFADFVAEQTEPGPIKSAFAKMRRMFRALKEWVTGNPSVQGVFEAVDSGRVGGRQSQGGSDARIRYQRQASARQKAQETFDQMPRDVAVPNRAVFDELFARNRSMLQNMGQARSAISDRMDVAREYMQDRILPLRRAQEAIERETGQPIAEEMNAYVKEETYHGKVGRRLDDIQQFTIEPISDLIADSNDLDTAKVNDYLTALHAEERNARIAKINPAMPDGGSGMTNAEAQKILKDAKMSKDYAALKEIDRLVSKLRDDTLQLRVDAGLMTAKDAAILKAMYKNYVPLKGFEDFDGSEVLSDRPNIGRGFSVKGPESKRALGRKSRSFDVLANILSQAQEVAIRAEKNRVGKAMFDLASQYPSENLWKVREVETKRVFNKQTGLVEARSEAPTARALAENEMAVKIDGKEYRIEFMDKRLTRAMGAVKVGQMGDLVRILSLPARYFSAVNTMIDPEFVVRNAFRDMQAAQINIRNFGEADRNRIAKGMIANWPKAFAAAYKGQGAKKPDTEWTKWYREFEEAGAKVSFWKMEDADRMKSDLDRKVFLKRGNIAQRAGKFAITPSAWFSAQDNAVLGFIERTNLAVDNAVRLAAYVEARKSGWSKQKAASLSKNLTVNFNRRGHYGPVMNALYPFYNAGMQGTQVLFRAMSNPKRMSKYVVGMIGIGFISDLINAAISDEDDDGVLAYDKIQKFKQEMSFQISTGDDVLTVPLPYGYNVFPYMGQLAGQVYRGVKDPDEAFVDFVDAAVSAFSPVYESDAMRTMLPMVLDLPYDLATNSDWLHRPIRPENPYGDYGPDAYKFYGGASEWAKGLADVANRATGGTIAEPGMIDISPEYLDHIWGFASGGAGRFVSNTGDMAAKILSGKTDEIEGYRVPFARQVFSETGVFLDRDRYYRFRDKVNAAAEARETAQEAGEPLSKLSYDLSKLKNEVKLADKVLRAIRKERAAVGDDATADQRKEWEAREAKAILRFNRKYVDIAGASIE